MALVRKERIYCWFIIVKAYREELIKRRPFSSVVLAKQNKMRSISSKEIQIKKIRLLVRKILTICKRCLIGFP
jgi:hypothetical protein